MTRRDRVIQALRHKETAPLPYQINFTVGALQSVTAYTGDEHYADTIGNHMCRCYGDKVSDPIPSKPGFFRDQFGVIWNRSGLDKDVGVVSEILLKEPELDSYSFPEADELRFRRNLEQAMQAPGDRFVTSNIGNLLFERAWILRGMENLLMDMICEPEFVHGLLERICDYQMQLIELSLQYPIDGFYFGDDYGQQHGLIMGPEHWRTYIKPYLKKIVLRIKAAGKYVALHSCGDLTEILPDLIEIGVDAYQTVQPEIYDLKAIKREFGRDITFWGAVSTQRDLPRAAPDELQRIIYDTIKIMGPGGGYILAPTHSLPADVPPENIVAMVDAFQHQAF